MNATRGIVTAVDREAGTVDALIGDAVVPGVAYMGDPPWPLAAAWFFNSPAWVCLGPAGDARRILHDDFCYLTTATSPPRIGDTGWLDGGTGAPSTAVDPDDGAGVLTLTTAGVDAFYRIRKNDRLINLAEDRVYWLSARVSIPSLGIIGASFEVGLADANVVAGAAPAATDARAAATAVSSGQWHLLTTAGATTTVTDSPELTDPAAWTWIDLLVRGGQWAALWADGSGPWFTDLTVPDPTVRSVTPYVKVTQGPDSAAMRIDCLTLATVEADVTVDPADIAAQLDA